MPHHRPHFIVMSLALVSLAFAALAVSDEEATPKEKTPEFPPFEEVAEGFERVISTAGGGDSLFGLWMREKDHQLLAEIPTSFVENERRFFLVPTVAGGDPELGVYSIWHRMIGKDDRLLYWIRFDKQLVLMEPNLYYRTTGDEESQLATDRVHTDSVVLAVPIVAIGPSGGPVVDLDAALMKNAGEFFGSFVEGADMSLSMIESAKAFPKNLELTWTFPKSDRQLATVHYSMGVWPEDTGYKTREADRRVGLYYVDFVDRSKYDGGSQKRRYVARWHLEKADPALKLSPPKRPITFYIEHTTPIRYRRWVRDGILAWNKAFERIGIIGAIEVHLQDARTGAHMEKDPEDLRYSFVRWTNSDMGYAIGPNHAHPETGEVYEADIVMDETFLFSWYADSIDAELAAAAMSAFAPELDPWLRDNPEWDPRYRFARAEDRPRVLRFQQAMARGQAGGLEAPPTMRPEVWDVHRRALGLPPSMCMCQRGKSASIALLRTAIDLDLVKLGNGNTGDTDADTPSLLDGLPEDLVGPLLKDVIMHEVGHTLGLMHNWKGSALHQFEEINSTRMKGKRSMVSTVMDYLPTNIVVEEDGLIQGDYGAIDIGPYDMWAIEWAYTFNDPLEVARRAAEPEHAFSAEEGQAGPDPTSKVWDLGTDSLDRTEAMMRFVNVARARIIDRAVDDNESWQKARFAYNRVLLEHFLGIVQATHWIGGAYVNKYRKGDPGATDPIHPVDADQQRRALKLVIDEVFSDEAFAVTPELLRKLASDNWYDEGFNVAQDYRVHDDLLDFQAVVLSMILNPTRLVRVLDNEMRVAPDVDALTVPEVFSSIRDAIWRDPEESRRGGYTNRHPMFSSLTRNLQREHMARLIDLAVGDSWPNASGAAVATLARQELREILDRIDNGWRASNPDGYTTAHLDDISGRIEKALEAIYIRND